MCQVHEGALSTVQLRGVDMKKYPEASFVKFSDWLVTVLVKWNIGHREAAQRYSAHGESEGSQQEMKAYYASIIKTAKGAGFELPYTTALRAYLN